MNIPVNTWNLMIKPEACDVEAKQSDLCYFTSDFAFMVERDNDINNVLCFRYRRGEETFKQAVRKFVWELRFQKIQFIRVTGRYLFMLRKTFLEEEKASGTNIFYDREESDREQENVFFVKLW